MHERILIPLDGSQVGESALPYVEDLLSKLSPEVKVEVTLLQVLRLLRPSVVSGLAVPDIAYTQQEMEESKKKAIDYLNKAGERLKRKGAAVAARVSTGDASEAIVKVAEEINADLIAMSTHGRSGLSRWAFGSVTDKVLRRGARVPILTVRGPGKSAKT